MKYEDAERKCFPKSRFPNIAMVKNFSPFLFSCLPEHIYTSYKYLHFNFFKGEILLHFVVQSVSHLTTYTTQLNVFNLAMYQRISFWNRIYKSTPLSFLIAAYYFIGLCVLTQQFVYCWEFGFFPGFYSYKSCLQWISFTYMYIYLYRLLLLFNCFLRADSHERDYWTSGCEQFYSHWSMLL